MLKNRTFKGALNFITFILLFTVSTSLYAMIFHMNTMKPIVTLSGGIAFPSNLLDDETLMIGSSSYIYSNARNKHDDGVVGVFVGEEIMVDRSLLWQFGLSYYYEQFNAKGNVLQGVDLSSADEYDYHFDVQSQQLLIETKLLLATMQSFHPYLSLGLGAAFNNAKNWRVNYPIFLTFTPLFSDNDETSFTYNIGLGFDYDINCNVRLGVGYRFRQIGKAELGDGVIDVTPVSGTLLKSHIYTNEILAQLSYTFA